MPFESIFNGVAVAVLVIAFLGVVAMSLPIIFNGKGGGGGDDCDDMDESSTEDNNIKDSTEKR